MIGPTPALVYGYDTAKRYHPSNLPVQYVPQGLQSSIVDVVDFVDPSSSLSCEHSESLCSGPSKIDLNFIRRIEWYRCTITNAWDGQKKIGSCTRSSTT
mmetsp:Transcript_11300/g.26868  ORF Transcript_11300/g.26868 Transcript_11300/m.26868 type:complete len:99 (-) Transcript_11300:1611-1907(-)